MERVTVDDRGRLADPNRVDEMVMSADWRASRHAHRLGAQVGFATNEQLQSVGGTNGKENSRRT